MADRREPAGHRPGGTGGARPTDPVPEADRERIVLLECRLEQARSALVDARADADRVRGRLAEVAAREADHARREGLLHEELAEARAEIAALHERLHRSEALRADLEGHLFEADDRGDAGELVRLRRELGVERQRALLHERTLTRLRVRVEELLSSRETLLARIAEWHQLVQRDGPEAADLAEFMAELRRDILELEQRNLVGARREAQLRDRLARAGLDPEAEPGSPETGGADEAPAPYAIVGAAPEPEPAVGLAHQPAEGLAHQEVGEPEPPVARVAVEAPAPPGPSSSPETSSPEPIASPDAPSSPQGLASAERLDVTAPSPAGAQPGEVGGAVSGAGSRRSPIPPHGPSELLITALAAADAPALQAELLLRLGRTGDRKASAVVRPWVGASMPVVRGAAYEALGRLLEGDPARLEAHLRSGLADPDARVRRRVVLAAATARRLALRPLLDPLRGDPDPQVRRLVREVLRHAPSTEADGRQNAGRAVPARVASGTIA